MPKPGWSRCARLPRRGGWQITAEQLVDRAGTPRAKGLPETPAAATTHISWRTATMHSFTRSALATLSVLAASAAYPQHGGHGGGHGAHSTGGKTPSHAAVESKAAKPPEVRTIEIGVISSGFDPAEIRLTRGEKVDLIFTRTARSSCATILRIKEMGVTRELPFDESVTVRLKPENAGRFSFGCPSGAVTGTLIVE
jgi:hypothetical protein